MSSPTNSHGDSGPETPSSSPNETQVDQSVSGPESSDEAGLPFPNENNGPDRVERLQVETDDNSLAAPVIVTPPGISLFDELPPLPDSPVESTGTTENRLPASIFDQRHDDSSNPLPSKSPAATPASDELAASLGEDAGSDLATSSDGKASSDGDDDDDGEGKTESKPKRAEKSRVSSGKKDSDADESLEDDEKLDNNKKSDDNKESDNDEKSDNNEKSDDNEKWDDNKSIHNPFDSEGTPSSPTDDPITSQGTSAKNLWERLKSQGEESEALDRLMALEGLEDAKIQFLKIKATIDAARERKGCLRRRDLNMAFLGNPGTGKTTLADIYGDFLFECGVWPDLDSPSTTKIRVINQYRDGIEMLFDRINDRLGTVVFDDIDQIDDDGVEIRKLMVMALASIPDNARMVVVLTGSVTGVSKLLGGRPQGRWNLWRRLQLQDYSDEQLRAMLWRLIRRNNLQVDGGPESPYPLIAARRIGRGRKTAGYGNIREVELAFEQMLERQAYRLKKAQLGTSTVGADASTICGQDETVLTMEDFIGPEPAEHWSESAAWKELNRMAGLDDVKKVIRSLMRRSKTNYRRELKGKEPLQTSLNRLFLGPPGTGKTTVAKLYGRILGELGYLSSSDVIFTTPSDFISEYQGQTESKTRSLINSATGKVLIIDDAHTFFDSSSRDNGGIHHRAFVDTLVSQIHNKPGEDRSVILIGYGDKMEDMIRKGNPGLKRRFPLEEAFRFHDYDDAQLNEILRIKMADEEITASKEAMDVAAEVLRRARDRPNFGNGGDVDNLLNQAKARFRERTAAEKEKKTAAEGARQINDTIGSTGAMDGVGATVQDHGEEDGDEESLQEEVEDQDPIALEPQDFDPEWDRGTNPEKGAKAPSPFDGLLGFDDIRKQFEDYQLMAAHMRQRGKDPRESIPFTYVFKGPPGTGKTHTARIMGKIFYRMGFLSTDEVVECSASHMIGQYVGQTSPKVISLLESALGKVLFIDEAYRLTSRTGGRGYESEAIGELVDCMTKPRYLRKMIIILAGYNKDMAQLLKSNAGLRGRFPTEIRFKPMDEELSRAHLVKLLSKQDIEICDATKPSSDDHETVLRLFYKLGMTEGWSNGRDIKSLADIITADVYKRKPATSAGSPQGQSGDAGRTLHVTTKELTKFLRDLFRERVKAVGGSGENSGDRSFAAAQ
ncbi:P-loop containing nucleoside triphosphate hydrolase protein [Cladorrhinum samala]|uniref:P-loop containing nucleoside triphosphate hydrolase protein n=1 Tax=Cladorrhinum samala TaxID=585594 RepID=A0AAV9HZD5_9PEZI|nr:P-loop containing nucleoside triphosphate hydrolase protein [Cladorrhinum samala]